jgi:uncharacterized protein (DUF983 family)
VLCVAGTFKAAAGVNTACDECQVGKFKAAAGVNTVCDACGAGKCGQLVTGRKMDSRKFVDTGLVAVVVAC